MTNHGTTGEYKRGCRCDQCRAAQRAYQVEWAEGRRAEANFQHGLNGYDNYGCRCDVCKEARANWSRKRGARNNKLLATRRARRRAGDESPPSELTHGIQAYREWRCRCDVCSAAARALRQRNRDSAKRRAGQPAKKWQMWTGAELETVAQHPDLSAVDLGHMLGRTPRGVSWARALLRDHPARVRVAGVSRGE